MLHCRYLSYGTWVFRIQFSTQCRIGLPNWCSYSVPYACLPVAKLLFEDESCLYSHSAWELELKMIPSCDADTATPHIVFLLAYTRINSGSIKIRALRRLPSSELLGLVGAVVNCCKSFLSQLSSTSPAACSNHREFVMREMTVWRGIRRF